MSAERRLASYGTLAPGRSNHSQLADLKGTWLMGTVRGKQTVADWGRWIGYPGFLLDVTADTVEVHIFQSDDLPDHWERLDAFEGEAYSRVVAQAQTDEGELDVSIYVLRPEPSTKR